MKSNRIVALLTAGALGLGSLSAFAQGHDERQGYDRGHDRGDQRHEDHSMGNRGHDNARHDDRGDRGDRGYGHDRQDVYYYGARGPEWHRGGRLPAQYREHQYVVDNWREHHLAPPPRGYHWVQVGNDYVLAAVATGIIAQLLLNSQY